MKIIYPADWGRVASAPEVVIFEPFPERVLWTRVARVGDNGFEYLDEPVVEKRSSDGLVRIFTFPELKANGRYAVFFYESRFDRVLGQIGLTLDGDYKRVSLAKSLNVISRLYNRLIHLRAIGNGVGKSGTTWLYRLIASLPGFAPVNMSGSLLSGITHLELSSVPLGHVYHGHLRYGLETLKEIESYDFLNFYIYRDIRDVVVSEYFHKFKMEPGSHRPDLVEKGPEYLLKYENIFKWSSSLYATSDALSWKESSDCVMVRYEDLLANPVAVLKSAFATCQLETDDALLDYIVTCNDFKVMTGRKPGEADPRSPVRNAVPGNWVEYFDADTRAKFSEKFGYYLDAFGYSRD
jgi:hypothetical protein